MMELPINKIICGDCLEVLESLPRPTMIFADPPDNIGMKYEGYNDKLPTSEYRERLQEWLEAATEKANIVWFSIYPKYLPETLLAAKCNGEARLFIWRFTFGQHNNNDCGMGYRPIVRVLNTGAKLYPDAIREPSKRQTIYNDKRANPAGRVPDDVWEFPRVCGTFKEKRKWHTNQHPEALIERIIKLSTKEGDLVIDMFAGTGTVNRVCQRLNRSCVGIEISQFYCDKINEELKGRSKGIILKDMKRQDIIANP